MKIIDRLQAVPQVGGQFSWMAIYTTVSVKGRIFFTFEQRWQAEFLSVEKNDTNFRKDDKGTFLFSL